jgi:arylsulfatase A-like enzyme
MYDEQSRVPLIVHLPQAMREALGLPESARTIRQQVRLVDLYPTILDLLEVPLTHQIHGRSLRPLLAGQRLPAVEAFSESIYWGPTEVKALRSERFKYFRGVPKEPANAPPAWEALYDLAADPAERVECRSANARVFAHMRSLVDRILAAGPAADEAAVPDDWTPSSRPSCGARLPRLSGGFLQVAERLSSASCSVDSFSAPGFGAPTRFAAAR